jgi:cobalt-zinc-cadmium efflux system membrane fusion protein
MRRAFVAVGLLAAVSCTQGPKGEAPSEKEAHGDHPPAAEEHGDDELVRVPDDMMRDLKLTTAVVEERPGGETTAVMGELHVDEDRYAEVASPLAAEAVELRAAAGDRVRAGETLAVLLSLEVGRARGSVGEAEARHALAEQALARKRRLADERIAPRREVQEAEAEEAAARAALLAARATLESLGAPAAGTGGRFALRAPAGGVVIERALVRGQVVEPGRALFKVGDLSRLWVEAHASERDAVRVAEGSSARVTIPALPGDTFEARVVLVGRQVDAASRTIPVRLALGNPRGLLRPGMSATVALPVGAGGTLLAVPAAALQRLRDAWCVFVPRGPGAFEARRVGRGRDLGGEVEVLSGLAAGETVVVEGAFLLKAEGEKAEGAGAHHDH